MAYDYCGASFQYEMESWFLPLLMIICTDLCNYDMIYMDMCFLYDGLFEIIAHRQVFTFTLDWVLITLWLQAWEWWVVPLFNHCLIFTIELWTIVQHIIMLTGPVLLIYLKLLVALVDGQLLSSPDCKYWNEKERKEKRRKKKFCSNSQ